MKEKELQRLLSGDAVDYVPLTWYVAEEYTINNHHEIIVKKLGDTSPYYPLKEAKLFTSFTRLGRYTHLSDAKILKWVSDYGLLKREPNEKNPLMWSQAVQVPMKITEFIREVDEARSASLLYYDLTWGGIESLIRRLRDVRENPSTYRPPSELDKNLLSLWEDELNNVRRDRSMRWMYTGGEFEHFLKRKLSGVNISLFTPIDECHLNPDIIAPAYRPRRSWSCSDLVSVMYLHFYLWVTGALPMRLCDNPKCRTPFPVTRTTKKVCSPGCRSSWRPSRRG